MKQIAVSADVFARIWAERQNGEDSENDILARILPSAAAQEKGREPGNLTESLDDGVRDVRSGTHFPEGFEIFRRFKGTDARAIASGGAWVLRASGARYASLNALSRGIGAGTENAWVNWHYLDGAQRQPLTVLRDPASISRRPKKRARAKPAERPSAETQWRDDVRQGLAAIEDGRGLLADIYKSVEKVRRAAGRHWPASADAVIRRTLEESSSDSHAYKGGVDLFAMPYGPDAGFWALR